MIGEVHDLLARYCHAVDRGTATDVLRLFASGATLIANDESHVGHDAIGAFYDGYFALCSQTVDWIRHKLTSPVVEFDGDGTAKCISYVDAQALWNDRRVMNTVVMFEDIVDRADAPSRWLFRERTLTTLAIFEVGSVEG